MTDTLKGFFLVPTSKNPDKGLWFVFHHESDGILAIDITKEHPDIPYRHFHAVLDGVDNKPLTERVVLIGGPEQSDTAMLVLHNNKNAIGDNHPINDQFYFQSYRFVLVAGHPPTIAKADDTPGKLELGSADFLIILGFRMWDMDKLEQELKDWQWTFLPASPEIVFHTPRNQRLQRALNLIN